MTNCLHPWLRTSTRVSRFLIAACALYWLAGRAPAQVSTADILGRVTDTTGASVASAKVTAENLSTNETRLGETNENGEYSFTLLPAGAYSINVEAKGFKLFTVANLAVAAGDRARQDATMQLGSMTERVEVEASAPALKTDTSTVGQLITQQAVQDLPLNGRNYIGLVQLAPGVNNNVSGGSKSSGLAADDRRPSQSITVGAQQGWVNNFLLDGLDNNDRVIGTVIVRPSVEALESINVLTTQYTAELGRTAGGVISIQTKTGGNAVHGSAYEYFRNNDMDAKGFQFTAAPKPEYRLNQYGGSAGGAIKKDKTFWFSDYEEFNLRQGLVAQGVSVPTSLMKQGIFTQPGLNTIYDPATLAVNPVTNALSRQPFQGNLIPTSRINPISANYMTLYPSPTGSGIVNNFASAFPKKQDSGTFDERIDHHFTDSQYIYGRYSYNDITSFIPGDLGQAVPGIYSGGTAGGPGAARQRAQGLHLNYVNILRPTLLLELKAAYSRYADHTYPLNFGNNISTQFGIPGANHDAVSSGLTTANPSGYDALGEALFVPIVYIDNVFQYQGALTWTKGAHTIKFGAALIRRQFTPYQSTAARGSFSFTNNNTDNTAGVGGNSIASFLLGYPSTSGAIPNSSGAAFLETLAWTGLRAWEPSTYVQDDWRVTPKLTLNLGFRYDVFTPYTEAHNQISNLNLVTKTIAVAGQNGVGSTAGVKTYYTNFAPRFGFAYTLSKTMVVRGGYGISYMPGQIQSQAALRNPPFISSWSANIVNNVPVSQMYSISQGFPAAVPVNPANITGNITLNAVEYNLRPTSVQNFSLSIQKEFAGNVFSIGYVGGLTRHNMQTQPINQPLPALPGVNVQTNRPFYSALPGVAGIGYLTDDGTLNYHSMQTTFERRLSQGLIVNANYTLSHALQSGPTGNGDSARGTAQLITDYALEKGSSSLDIRHRVAVSANYQLPFGKNAHGWKKQLIGGWQSNVVGQWQTGLPFTVTNLSPRTNIGTDRPNRLASGTLSDPTLLKFFDTSAFAVQPLGQIGTSGVNILRGPHLRQVDFSVFKNFALRERFTLQFRTEMYNISNTTNFGLPNAQVGNSSFGRISTLATGPTPRQLQLALKLLF